MSVLAAIKGLFSCFGREKAPIHPPVQLSGPPWTRSYFSGSAWFDADNCRQIDLTDLRGQRCFGGLDLASTRDLVAFSLVFPPLRANEAWRVLVWAWIPQQCQGGVSDFADEYRWLVEQGSLVVAGSEYNDSQPVVAAIRKACADFDVVDIGFDVYNSNQVMGHPFLGSVRTTRVEPTGKNAGAALKHMEYLLMHGRFQHGGNPLLGWCACNASVNRDAQGRLRLSKKHSRGPIAPLTATVLAISRALADEKVAALYGSAVLRS